jgi:hypothetical protein
MAERKSNDIIARFIAKVSVAAFIVVVALQVWLFARCFYEVRNVPDYAAYPSVRVLFYGSGTDSVSARFSLFDTAGREFAVIDRSWTAEALSFDFTTATFGGRSFVFPFRIRPSEERSGGTDVTHYYIDRKQCMLLGSPCTARQKLAMYRLALFSFSMATRFSSRFSAVQTVHLAQCEMGRTYDILTDSNGLLKLVPM